MQCREKRLRIYSFSVFFAYLLRNLRSKWPLLNGFFGYDLRSETSLFHIAAMEGELF